MAASQSADSGNWFAAILLITGMNGEADCAVGRGGGGGAWRENKGRLYFLYSNYSPTSSCGSKHNKRCDSTGLLSDK
jgi:hypothetical protein